MEVRVLNDISKEDRARVVATAGNLSRFNGNVMECYADRSDYEKNVKLISSIIKMGHESICDHDYFVIALKDVSAIVEQILIEERIASFTIKSRRNVDFKNAGYYVPDFHDEEGNLLKNNDELKNEYRKHMDYLFDSYGKLIQNGIILEDARFVMPYSFNSNIIMGCDAHVLKDLVVKLTKTRLSKIGELKELWEKLRNILHTYSSYYDKKIDSEEVNTNDVIRDKLLEQTHFVKGDYKNVVSSVRLLDYTDNVDEVIIKTLIMKKLGCNSEYANYFYEHYLKKGKLKYDVMKELYNTSFNNLDNNVLKSVNFRFELALSLAVLTHFTRHRTHDPVIPEFTTLTDISQYKIPPSIACDNRILEMFKDVFSKNMEVREYFKDNGVRDEDLVYFLLSGNLVNVTSNIDGATLVHMIRLRLCEKAQWEIKNNVKEMRDEVRKISDVYSSILGPTCEIIGKCFEGRESCGKVKALRNNG